MTVSAYGSNDYLIERAMRRKNTQTGIKEPAAGLIGAVGFFSATLGGEAIHASLSTPLTERSANSGRYFGILDGPDLALHLADFDGETIWECVRFPSDYEAWLKVKFKMIRSLVA